MLYVCNNSLNAIRHNQLKHNGRFWCLPKEKSHATIYGFDLHISKFQFKTEKQQCLFHLLPSVSLFLSRSYLLSSHVTNFRNTVEKARSSLQWIHRRRRKCGEMLKKQQNVQFLTKIVDVGYFCIFCMIIMSVSVLYLQPLLFCILPVPDNVFLF